MGEAGACREVDERLSGIWDEGRRGDLSAVFVDEPSTWDGVDAAASQWVDRWTVVYSEHCQEMSTAPDRPEHLERLDGPHGDPGWSP